MATRSEFAVTLSPELFDYLKAEADRLDVPMEWLVASLVCDTMDQAAPEPALA